MSYLESLMSANEEVRLTTRRHWITLLRAAFVYGIALSALALAAGFGAGADRPWGPWLAVIAAALMLLPAFLLARDLATWYGRQYVVTTRRVLQIAGVLNKRVSDSNLDKVNDIVMTQSMLGRMLGYGTVQIITGSDVGVDVLEDIKDPVGFKRVMLDNKEDFDSLARSMVSRDEQEDIPGALARLADLRDKGVVSEAEFERKKAELLERM